MLDIIQFSFHKLMFFTLDAMLFACLRYHCLGIAYLTSNAQAMVGRKA
jgi:hypothetical protein